MNKIKLIQERIDGLLIEQNQGQDIITIIEQLNNDDILVNIETRPAFLQINNLADILDDTNFTRIAFIIGSNVNLNIQSEKFQYLIHAGEYCIINSYFLNGNGSIEIKLSANCELNYKGSHKIKSSTNCTIKNANSSK